MRKLILSIIALTLSISAWAQETQSVNYIDADGQVQVICDLLGYTDGFLPKHAKRFAEIGKIATSAIEQYKNDVKDNAFPTSEQSF